MAKFSVENVRAESAIALQDTTSDYSVGLCQSFADTLGRLGSRAPAPVSYKQGDTDFTAQLRKIREMRVGAVFIPGYPPELPLIVNQARQLGLSAVLLGADGWDNEDLVANSGANLKGTYFSAAFSTEVATPPLEEFLALAAKNGVDNPGTFEALGYDSMGLVAEAVSRAPLEPGMTLKAYRREIRDALAAISNYQGATGTITMQSSGDPIKSLVVLRYDVDESGKVVRRFVKVVNH